MFYVIQNIVFSGYHSLQGLDAKENNEGGQDLSFAMVAPDRCHEWSVRVVFMYVVVAQLSIDKHVKVHTGSLNLKIIRPYMQNLGNLNPTTKQISNECSTLDWCNWCTMNCKFFFVRESRLLAPSGRRAGGSFTQPLTDKYALHSMRVIPPTPPPAERFRSNPHVASTLCSALLSLS